jgi:uncharacterized protein (DUF952 family)
MMSQRTILHLVSQSEWEAALPLKDYLPSAFAADGFIHCTFGEDELLAVANRFYRQVPGEFLVLEIDESKVTAPIKWEPPIHPDGTPTDGIDQVLYPHIYGPLNRSAITGIKKLVRNNDGWFVRDSISCPSG